MRFIGTKFIALMCAACATASFAACGDNDSQPDARVPTEFDGATPGAPDAGPVSGTIAVLDLRVTNNLGPLQLAGGAIAVSFSRPSEDKGDEVVNTGLVGCVVTVYDLDANPPKLPAPELDEGDVTITGTASPAGVCKFNTTAKDYVCVAGAVALPAGTIVGAGPQAGTATVTNLTVDWSTNDPVGMFVTMSGFAMPANNGTFAVLAVADAPSPAPAGNNHVLVIANASPAAETTTAAASATFIAGAGPTPAHRDFLVANDQITINKAAGMEVPAIPMRRRRSPRSIWPPRRPSPRPCRRPLRLPTSS
jgi:hypothetical protein